MFIKGALIMNKQLVQLIVIRDNHILLSCEKGTGNEQLSLISIENNEVNDGIMVLKEELSSNLNLEIGQCFQFSREVLNGTVTFAEQESVRNLSIDKYVSSNSCKWIPFEEAKNINTIARHLVTLYSECIDRDYEPEWLDALESVLADCSTYRYSLQMINKKRQARIVAEEDSKISTSEKVTAVFMALFLGIVFDRFFVNRVIGISYPIFVLLTVAFFFWTLRKKLSYKKSAGWLLLIPIFLLSLTFALFTNEILMYLNIILIPFLMVCSSILISDHTIAWDRLSFINKVIERAISLALENFAKPFRYIRLGVKSTNLKEMSPTKKNILRGLLISLPLLFVVTALLASADMVFQHYISSIFSIFDNLEMDFGRTATHSIAIAFTALYLFGYVWSFKYPYKSLKSSGGKAKAWEPVTVLTIIFAINVVYLMFTIIQFSYLYGGGTNILPQGYTYAEYARKGFFELVTVTVINFAILLSSMKYMKKDNRVLNNTAKVFFTLLILFTINMLISAHYKMSLYEGTYGLTYLRVFVHYFMLLLFILLLMAFTAIWYKKFPLAKAMLITSLTMYVILNYINVDAIIAERNIRRYVETGKIDVQYFRNLSQDAVPYMLQLYNDKDPYIRGEIRTYLDNREKIIDTMNSWSEFNYSRYKAKRSFR
jgi:hypothetical protein